LPTDKQPLKLWLTSEMQDRGDWGNNMDDEQVTLEEVADIREMIAARFKAVEAGTEPLLDFDAAFDEITTEVFGSPVS
jgi:hypothetical protein